MKDFYQDFGHNLIKIFQDRDMPGFMKEAEYMDESKLASLPDSAFACSDSRTLPLIDAANTYVSAAYYYGANQKNASVEERIVKAAKLFNVEKEVAELANILGGTPKTASPEATDSWEIVIQTENGTKSFSGEGVASLEKFAEEFVGQLFDRFSFDEKMECADKIASCLVERKQTVPQRILQVSGRNVPNTEKLAEAIIARAIRLPEDSEKAQLCKIANDIKDASEKDLQGMKKLAEMLDSLDKKYFLNRFYATSVPDPFASVYNTPKLEAVKLAGIIKVGSSEYSYEDLASVDQDIFRIALPSSSQDKIGLGTKDFCVSKLATLPQEELDQLAEYLP